MSPSLQLLASPLRGEFFCGTMPLGMQDFVIIDKVIFDDVEMIGMFSRYVAICQPLSGVAQYSSDCKKMIALIWFIGIVTACPWALFTKVIQGVQKYV